MKIRPYRSSFSFAFLAIVVAAAHAQVTADDRPLAPQLSSRAGASYTMYLDFEGFNFSGSWGGDSGGVTSYAAYGNASGSFDAHRVSQIQSLWARVAEKYSAFNINVTTVDPAKTSLGSFASDSARQAYYDANARIEHSIITPTGAANNSTAGGVSWVGTAQYAYGTGTNGGAGYGYHTNFIYAPADPIYDMDFAVKTMAETVSHEDGHALGLNHQSDYYPDGHVDEYSSNYGSGGGWSVDAPANTFAPVMGFSTFHQRGLWRSGRVTAFGGGIQNDASVLYSNDGMGGPVEDGIGNSFSEASDLALLTGGQVDSSRAKGIVVPTSTNPDPVGSSNYQGGYFKFRSSGGTITLRATNGSSYLADGVADPGMTLENKLMIYDANHNLVSMGTEDSLTRWTEFSGSLAAGDYYAFVTSTGGFVSSQDSTARYFNMGSYFLSGSGFAAVPEPASFIAIAAGAGILMRRRKRA